MFRYRFAQYSNTKNWKIKLPSLAIKMNLEIPLIFSRAHFEEIYFLNDRGHYLKDPRLKPIIRNFLLSVVGTVIAVLIPFLVLDAGSQSGQLGILIVFGTGFCIGQLASLIFAIAYYAKWRELKAWKREINHFLDTQEKVQHHTLILTDDYFSLKEDEQEKIEKWSNFIKVELDVRFILLVSQQNYLFPAKSMSEERFGKLGELISERVKMSRTSV